jgi:hypothetical protein
MVTPRRKHDHPNADDSNHAHGSIRRIRVIRACVLKLDAARVRQTGTPDESSPDCHHDQ